MAPQDILTLFARQLALVSLQNGEDLSSLGEFGSNSGKDK